MLVWLAVALFVGCALSLAVRTGAASARAVNVFAMLFVAAAAIVPPIVRSIVEPAGLQVVITGAPTIELRDRLAQLQAAAQPSPEVEVVGAGSDLAAALARAALRAGPRREDSAVVWTAPFRVGLVPDAPIVGASATVVPPLPFSPDALAIHFSSAPRERRPVVATFAVDGLAAVLTAEFSVTGDGWSARARGEVGDGRRVEVEMLPAARGFARVEVVVEAAGRRVSAVGQFEVGEAPSVLVLEPSGAIARALRAQGIRALETASLPAGWEGVDAVALGASLTVDEQRRLQRAVDDGLGLFVFGKGLQQDGEPLRDTLPVRVLPQPGAGQGPGSEAPVARDELTKPAPDRSPQDPDAGVRNDDPLVQPGGPVEVDKHAIAMVLVVDRSASMGDRVLGGQTKMSYAKTSARETARALGEGDEVGLITFGNDDLARVELALTDATQFSLIEAGIAKLAHFHESTHLDSGLTLAREMLGRSKAAVRHVVVLTDGGVWDQELVLRQRANAMRKDGLTLSMISIMDDSALATFQGMAERIAREGGGSFLPVRDPRKVPQLVSAEVVRALNRVGRKPKAGDGPGDQDVPPEPPRPDPMPEPEPEPPKPAPVVDARVSIRAVAKSPLLEPTPAQWPELLAAIPAAARASAHVLLVAGDAGQPLLAFGNVGLGRVGAFAADLAGEAAGALRAEAEFPARLSQWVVAVQRAAPAAPRTASLVARVEPPAPTPVEVAALAAMSGSTPTALGEIRIPPPRTVFEHVSQAPDWSLAAIAAVLLLAWWERRGVRRIG
jgi:Mg-chelatase subunit ChlD